MITHGKGDEEYCVDVVKDNTTMSKEEWEKYKIKLIDNYNLPDVGYPRVFKYYPQILGDDGKLYKDPNDKSTLL